MNCYNISIILDLASWHSILAVPKNCVQSLIYCIQFLVCVIMDIAGVAIVAYLLERTLNPFSDVGRVNTMMTSLAFGHASNL